MGAEEAKRRETLRVAEGQAKAEGKGVWSEEPESVSLFLIEELGADWQQRLVSFQMPSDPHAFISENKDRDFDGELFRPSCYLVWTTR